MKCRLAFVCGSVVFGAGCRTPPVPPAAPPVAAVRTDVAGLAALVTLSRLPLATTWQQTRIGDGNFGPSDLRLVAVLQFSPNDAKFVETTARQSAQPRSEEIEVLPWFPATIRQGAKRGSNGALVLRGQSFKPDAFARMSLQNGKLVRVEKTDFFVLSLFST